MGKGLFIGREMTRWEMHCRSLKGVTGHKSWQLEAYYKSEGSSLVWKVFFSWWLIYSKSIPSFSASFCFFLDLVCFERFLCSLTCLRVIFSSYRASGLCQTGIRTGVVQWAQTVGISELARVDPFSTWLYTCSGTGNHDIKLIEPQTFI